MDLGFWLGVYLIAIAAVGVLIFRDDVGPKFLIEEKNRRLGPTYWGVYQGSDTFDALHEQTITPPEPCKEEENAVGSGGYAGGKAISSAKS